MQQNPVIAELCEYMDENPPDKENVGKAVEYLDACRSLFERGILAHEKITNEQSPVLENMSHGLMTFLLVGLTTPGSKVIKFIKNS